MGVQNDIHIKEKKEKKKKSWFLQVETKMVHGQPMGKSNSKDTSKWQILIALRVPKNSRFYKIINFATF